MDLCYAVFVHADPRYEVLFLCPTETAMLQLIHDNYGPAPVSLLRHK